MIDLTNDHICEHRTHSYTQWVLENGATAVGLPGGFVAANQAGCQRKLLSTNDALQQLARLRAATATLGIAPLIFACTAAREAGALARDDDPRDRRFMTGARTADGFSAYCGGIDGCIGRAVEYARYSDVLCFRASRLDWSDAERFAAKVREQSPGKRLGFCFAPDPAELHWSPRDHVAFEKKLRQMGYRYYFFTQLGSTVFHSFPQDKPWIYVDDRAKSAAAASEDLNDLFVRLILPPIRFEELERSPAPSHRPETAGL
jgi:isocitrate lyase